MAEAERQRPSEEDEGHYLSNHCVAMRKALRRCLDMSKEMETLSLKGPPKANLAEPCDDTERATRLQEAQRAARSVHQYRTENLDSFHASAAAAAAECNNGEAHSPVAVLEDVSQTSPRAFRRSFEHANLPCKLSRLPAFCFDKVARDLVVLVGDPAGNDGPASDCRAAAVNRSWFLERFGPEATVPVRVEPPPPPVGAEEPPTPSSPTSGPEGTLDAEGRATECETQLMTVRQWISYLDDAASKDDPGADSTGALYLKDWHLQSLLSRQHRAAAAAAPSTEREVAAAEAEGRGSEVAGWYHVPSHFGHDVLNHFLTTFFVDDKGNYTSDYYFCYWGPAGSRTSRHSDVLNSFSWSYNVCGRKQWTFYPPPLPGSDPEPEPGRSSGTAEPTIVLHQEAGECVFVPSGWQHSVINCEEALSLNHNWITTANVDLVWTSLCLEMEAIERELASWRIPSASASNLFRAEIEPSENKANDDLWDARESMLRGCVGLDVTAFYLMVLFSITNLLSRAHAANCSMDDEWEFVFDATRLRDILQSIIIQSDSIHLAERLQASLSDPALAIDALNLGETVIAHVHTTLEACCRRSCASF